MYSQEEADIITKGIELSWTAWGKMRGQQLFTGDINYVKSENGKGIERIFSVSIEENAPFRIQQMISYIKAGIMPDSMLITPNTKPSNLAEELSDKGFIIDDAAPCMMMYLDDYIHQNHEQPSFAISKVTDIDQLADWVKIVNDALFGRELVSLEQFNDILVLDNTHFYLGLLNHKPVTACMTIVGGDTSVVDMVATLEEHRRNGFASALIHEALTDLRLMGVKTVSLRAEADGVGVYKRLGFRECFKRIVAACDWKNVYKKACPCFMENEPVQKAKQIWEETGSGADFVTEMNRQNVIGRELRYNPDENAIYLTKRYACDCGGGCPSNETLIGKRCHCEYVNHLAEYLPMSYCQCCGTFYEPMFFPLFGDSTEITPVHTVLSGSEECVFKIKVSAPRPSCGA